MASAWETREAFIVVRTYPTPAAAGVEVSCTAAITRDGQWLRLFPVPWRYLEKESQFRRYQWVSISVAKARSDPRRESYRIDKDRIQILESVRPWADRKRIVLKLESHCLCCLKAKRTENRTFPTLGIFRPKSIERLIITEEDPEWTKHELVLLQQGHLFDRKLKQLEKIPYSFRYEFHCDHDGCNGHKLKCTDWEMAEAYREWKHKYGDDWEAKFRQKFEGEMIHKFDTHFYVGTVNKKPASWIICGLFYPPHMGNDLTLFDTPLKIAGRGS